MCGRPSLGYPQFLRGSHLCRGAAPLVAGRLAKRRPSYGSTLAHCMRCFEGINWRHAFSVAGTVPTLCSSASAGRVALALQVRFILLYRYLFIYTFIYLFTCSFFIYLIIYLFVFMFIYIYVCIYIYRRVCVCVFVCVRYIKKNAFINVLICILSIFM